MELKVGLTFVNINLKKLAKLKEKLKEKPVIPNTRSRK